MRRGPAPGGTPSYPAPRPHLQRRHLDVEDAHKKTKCSPLPLTYTYTCNIYIHILGPSSHFHTSMLFVPSSCPSYMAPM
ncbi:hypothetical protein HanRHA438_Chr02g0081521 [Helianthus annuus]|nr:hypothetical protein HanRHA438_Chr02g0081521 [Helianthus annuus]